MPRTLIQLRDDTLRELGVLAPGESATADDATLVERTLTELHASWADLGITTKGGVAWALSAVPDQVSRWYAVAAAAWLGGVFGLPADRRGELLALEPVAEGRVRAYSGTRWDPDTPTPIDGIEIIDYPDDYPD